MKARCALLALLLTGRLLAAPTPLVPTRHLELFNGHDFSGWTFCLRNNSDPAATWSVTNGVIHCTGTPIGYLRTEQAYANYRLTTEWRFRRVTPKADNTGVLVHIQLPDHPWPRCVQVQGRHGHQGDLFLMMGAESNEHRGLNQNTPLPLRGGPNENPVGQWDTVQTICETAGSGTNTTGTVKAYVNGRLMNETTGCTLRSGFIGIQSEGGDIEIRKMSLDPLP